MNRVILICGEPASERLVSAIKMIAACKGVSETVIIAGLESFGEAAELLDSNSSVEEIRKLIGQPLFELKAPKPIYDCKEEPLFKRDRDYPTLREGMRRKQINKLRK